LAVGAAVAGGWLMAGTLKVIVARPRPEWTDAVHRVVAPETDASYPSGHVAFVTALATVLILLTWRTAARGWVLAGGVMLVVVTALARVYAVVHYPSDVVAGAVCAVCGVILGFAAMEMFERRRSRNGGTATAI
ncbi:MAG TPA: phosphatase PAP2 family protein, partial [Microbacterium sp.]|nr:phosphatase PAP2 family protein [Microbacterium sp.]